MKQKLLPDYIGPYRIIRDIGRGLMAIVFLVEDNNGEQKAIKLLQGFDPNLPETQVRLSREYEINKRLHHPAIVEAEKFQIYEWHNIKYPCIVMEYVPGGDLANMLRLRGKPLSIEETVQISWQICSALSSAHQASIIHRDIKPSNILLTGQGNRIKITDFDIADTNRPSIVKLSKSTRGTAAYISPEQTNGEDGDQRSDIYSLGVVIYQMLTEFVPFEAIKEAAVLDMHRKQDPKPIREVRAEIPQRLASVIHKALNKKPSERFQTALAMAAELEGIAEQEGIDLPNFNSPSVRIKVKRAFFTWTTVRDVIINNVANLVWAIGFAVCSIASLYLSNEFELPFFVDNSSTATPTPTTRILSTLPSSVTATATRSLTTPMVTVQASAIGVITPDVTRSVQPILPTQSPTTEIIVPTATRTSTFTPSPTYTIAPTNTLVPTPTRLPQPSSTFTVVTRPLVQVTVASVNVRTGPSTNFPVISTLLQGQVVEVIGKNTDGTWYNILLPQNSRGWIASSTIQALNLSSIQAVPIAATIPSSPIPTSIPPSPIPTSIPPSATPSLPPQTPTSNPPISNTNSIYNVVNIQPASPATLRVGDRVTFTFEYRTSEPDAIRIGAGAAYRGERIRSAPFQGYIQYQSSTGFGQGFFTVSSDASSLVVDSIYFEMISDTTKETLTELYVPVNYTFTP